LIVFHFETLLRNLNLGVYNMGKVKVEFQENNTKSENFFIFSSKDVFLKLNRLINQIINASL